MSQPWVFEPHCAIFLIGPSQSGKTTLCTRLFAEAEWQLGPHSCLYLSSDKIRDRLLHGREDNRWQPRADKYGSHMTALSEAAFQILTAEFKAALQFPCAKPVILVDTTGLSESFRQPLVALAGQHNYSTYALVFDLPLEQLLHDRMSADRKSLIARQHRRIRQEVLKSMKPFTHTYRLRDRPDEHQVVTFSNAALYVKCQLDPNVLWHVIGDVHASFDPLMALLRQLKGVTLGEEDNALELEDNVGLVFAGDIIDKGVQPLALLEWLARHCDHLRVVIVQGNHESRVMNRLMKVCTEEVPASFQNDHSQLLAEHPQAQAWFRRIFTHTVPFAQNRGTEMHHVDFIVTHSPCETKYLGRVDRRSQSKQRYYHYDRTDQYVQVGDFLRQNGNNSVWHIFGHVPVAEPRLLQRYIALDTGCGMGGRLSAVTMFSKQPRFKTVADQTMPPVQPPLINIPLAQKDAETQLEPLLAARVKRMIRDHINFISGTVSPSAAQPHLQLLESVSQALVYFQSKQCTKVVLQPKYMGSRCQLYLFVDDLERCYAVSRNGFRIKWTENQVPVFRQICLQMLGRLVERFPDLQMALVDGEILPWSFLGQGLIADFERYGQAAHRFHQVLQQAGFHEALQGDQAWLQQFQTDYQPETQSKALVAKRLAVEKRGFWYGKYQNLRALLPLTQFATWGEQQAAIQNYQRQLALYARPLKDPRDISFAPFDVLKVVSQNQEERVMPMPPDQAFALLSQDHGCVVDLTGDWKVAQAFFDECVERGLEGVVVKPLDGHAEVPFLKVRNPEYLTLIYGPFYQYIPSFIKNKSIGRRLKSSEMEYNLGLQMLKRPYATLPTDEEYRRLLIRFVQHDQEASAQTDARL